MDMQPEPSACSPEAHPDCSVLITITTPGSETPICRFGSARDILGGITVRQLIERVSSRQSVLSAGVPSAQLEAESTTASAVRELIAARSAEVLLASDNGGGGQAVDLEAAVSTIAERHTGEAGSSFISISLEVRPLQDAAAPAGRERREVMNPPAVEVAPRPPAAERAFAPERPRSSGWALIPGDEERSQPIALGEASHPRLEPGPPPAAAQEPREVAQPPAVERASGAPAVSEPPARPAAPVAGELVTIVAEGEPEIEAQPPQQGERKEYIRKSDWLRAQFLPEVEALDFSGLFVGNLGLGVREQASRRVAVLADPSRITEILLQGNSYRRSGDHAKALICYQELVDIDAANPDFRYLLGKTFLELGQLQEAAEAFVRAKELGHEGAQNELDQLNRRPRRRSGILSFLRFWR